MSEQNRYRVYVEKYEGGWVEVSAPDEQIARDRAQDVACRDWWYPERSHATTSLVEMLRAAPPSPAGTR